MSESREARVDAALAEYLAACDAGTPPDRDAFLERYPDLAGEIAAFLTDHERLRAAADPDATAGHVSPAGALPTLRYVGDYELLEEIARGGMGVVYRTRQVSVNRVVAVKMILAGNFADEADVRRFRTEAEAAANLDHPHILPIYEVSEHDGRPYFSMKLAEGGSLAGKKLPPRESAALVAKLARAVHFAHQRGILHRDLKPANVLLDAQGEPLVADFGLAKRVEGDAGMTVTGAVVGTPSYMPPEQARGERVTTAADVYSLGAILYECLTGRPPFREASVMETLFAVINREPEAITGTDRDLAVVVMKCLPKEPRERYASAADLADDLERWSRGEPIQARPAGVLERSAKWVRRNPALAALLAATALLVVVVPLTLVVTFLWQEAESSRGRAELALGQAESSRNQAELALGQAEQARQETGAALQREQAALAREAAARERVEHLSYLNRVDLAARNYQASQLALARGILAECPPHRRGWEWNLVDRLCHPPLVPLLAERRPAGESQLSPNGRWLVRLVQEGTPRKYSILVDDALTGKRIVEEPAGTNVGAVFDHAGDRLAWWAPGQVVVWDLLNARPLHAISNAPGGRLELAGDRLAFCGGNPAFQGGPAWVQLRDLRTGETLQVQRDLEFPQPREPLPSGMEHSGASCRIAASGSVVLQIGRRVGVIDLAGGKVRFLLERPGDWIDSIVALDPEGKEALLLTLGGLLRRWSLQDGRLLGTIAHTGMRRVAADWSRNLLATLDLEGRVRIWDLQVGILLGELPGHSRIRPTSVTALSFHQPTGHLVSQVDNELLVRDPLRGTDARSFDTPKLGSPGGSFGYGFCPPPRLVAGERRLVTTHADGAVRAWDRHTGKLLRTVTDPKGARSLELSENEEVVYLVYANDLDGPAVLAVEITTGKVLSLRNFAGYASELAILSPGGRQVALRRARERSRDSLPLPDSPQRETILDVTTGAVIAETPALPHLRRSLPSSDGSSWLTLQRGGDLRRFDLAPGSELKPLDVLALSWPTEALHIQRARQRERLLVATNHGLDYALRVVDLASAREVSRVVTGEMKSLRDDLAAWPAISSDGRLVASGGERCVQIWDAETGQLTLRLPVDMHAVHLAFTPDGQHLVAAGNTAAGGKVYVFDGSPRTEQPRKQP